MAESLSEALLRLIDEKPVDSPDRHTAARLLLDAAANIAAGVNSEPGRCFLHWARGTGIIDRHGRLCGDPGRRALLLGALCHIQEVDDLHRTSVTHPGCVVAPVLWALSGQTKADPLLAFLRGVEATTRIGIAVGPAHYRIWHNTATCGPFGAAVAAAYLIGLDRPQTVMALGNAGTQSAGLWEFLDSGAMTKHLHAGRAAEAGLVSAQMADAGITGPGTILEGPRGFFAAMCRDGQPNRVTVHPDAPWQVHQTSIKPWPSCRHTHPAIDACSEIRGTMRARKIDPESITRIAVETYDAALALCDRPSPQNTYAAKFSLQHCVAAAIGDDQIAFASFDHDGRGRHAALRDKVSVAATASHNTAYPDSWGATVRIEVPDGTGICAERTGALGDPEMPLSDDALIGKSRTLLRHAGHPAPDALIDAIFAMADENPLPELALEDLISVNRSALSTPNKKRPHEDRAA